MSRTREDVADLYSRVAPDYAEIGPPYFAHAGRRLVELADVREGDRVLDLGTGRGAVLLPAAQHVGQSGHALGIDIAPGMLEHTRRAIESLGLVEQASVQLMDAAHLELEPNQFSHVLSSFSVFFFSDLPRALSELQRVLRPGGTLGFAFSRGTDPRWSWYEQLLRNVGALDNLSPPVGYPQIRQTDVLTGLLQQAGFADPHERQEPTEFYYASPEDWWASLWVHGSRRPLERMAPDVLERVRTECLARAAEMRQPRGLPETLTLVYILARRGG